MFAAFALVFVGMLFGFNIQINADTTNFFASVGSLIGGISAAIAAFFSYRSVGEWRNQMQHSLLYEHFSNLEVLLQEYVNKVNRATDDIESIPIYKVLTLASRSASDVREEYESNYHKIHGLIPTHLQTQVEELNIYTLNQKYNVALQACKIRDSELSRYTSKNKIVLDERSLDELPAEIRLELFEKTNAAAESYSNVMLIGNTAKSNLNSLRASLLKKE
ncbi:hypothetical protein [Vibrio splendidus]|uniref:hypothetical protein n=1 Tax=Vibrio splendidus TaxID=29497 RepID=UPI0011B273B6|nr:hypothetical protein [Vibrio splendidus]